MTDELDDQNTDGDDTDDDSQGAAGEGSNEESDGSDGKALSAMQSERDKETARANKAEKALASSTKAASAKGQEWIDTAMDNQKRALFEGNPKFAQYEIPIDLIIGETPAEMVASTKSLSQFVDTMEGKMRGKILTDHGLDPEPKDTPKLGRAGYADMPQDQFDKLVEEARKG